MKTTIFYWAVKRTCEAAIIILSGIALLCAFSCSENEEPTPLYNCEEVTAAAKKTKDDYVYLVNHHPAPNASREVLEEWTVKTKAAHAKMQTAIALKTKSGCN